MKRITSSLTAFIFNYQLVWASMVIFLMIASIPSFSQDKERGIHIGIVYPLSTYGVRAKEYTNIFSLHAIAGVSRAEKGFTSAGFANIIAEDAAGFQVAGFANVIGGAATGFQGSGFVNIYREAQGVQLAGFANLAKHHVTGAQASGFLNMARNFEGFQLSGFMNKADSVEGAQAGGTINMAGDVNGTQFSGFINIADDVTGSQLAGFINIAKKVKGVQFAGFINIADSSDYPIGIVNIIRNGEKRIGITADDNLTTMLTFRSGGRKLYGIIGVGYNFENDKHELGWQYGIGAHLFERRNFRLNTEATMTSLENFKSGEFTKFSLGVLPAFRVGSVELFAGPQLNYVNTDTAEGRELISDYLWDEVNSKDRLKGLYIGYTVGVHMKL